jgi:thymidylate kinase
VGIRQLIGDHMAGSHELTVDSVAEQITQSLGRESVANRQEEFIVGKIALDGCCRTGKGEQLKALNAHFTSRGVPTMVLKGDGTRLGAGESWHDLGSRYWTHRHDYHAGLHTPRSEWDVDSYTLARENRIWLTALEGIAKVSRSRFALAIFDRSIISRATLAIQREGLTEGKLTEEQMWPPHLQIPGEEVTYAETQPDILFNLTAPQEVLESRISQTDYDRAFRLRAVYEYYDDFVRAKEALPESTTTKIVDLDGEAPINVTTETILSHLGEIYPEVHQINNVPRMYPSYSE